MKPPKPGKPGLSESEPSIQVKMMSINVCFDKTAMLPVLESARQSSQTVKRLEAENCQLKAAIEQHEADAKRQGNMVSSACCW